MINTKKREKTLKSFTCAHCGHKVSENALGTQHRNHCPHCLWSLHVDARIGDRRAQCRGEMKPEKITYKKDGEQMIEHICMGCGKRAKNRVAGDDDMQTIELLEKKNPRICIGTLNPEKEQHLSRMAYAAGYKSVLLREQEDILEADEGGDSFEENASKKAQWYSEKTALLTIATDGGVDIPALGDGWEKLHTKRNSGIVSTDTDRIEDMLKRMESFRGDERRAQFTESLAIASDGEVLGCWTVQAPPGKIGLTWDAGKRIKGFWLASILIDDELGKPYAEMTPRERKKRKGHWKKLEALIVPFLRHLHGKRR